MPDDPIDIEHLNEVTDNDKAFQKELFVLFMQTAESCIQSLQSLYANENTKKWREKAHELKGSSANLGANVLAGICKQAMEAEQLPSDQKHKILISIQNEYALIKDYFQKHIA